MLLAGVLWALLFRTPSVDNEVRSSAITLTAIAILATWAWAGHSSTQRWSDIGMPVDIAHHAAAALWIAGLLIVGLFATQQLSAPRLAPIVERLSTAASIAVAIIVLTGIIQSIRLVGSPGDLFAADHGKYLALKLVVVAAMLGVAALNRRSVRNGQLRAAGAASSIDTQRLRRSILAEFALGLIVIAITSAMVVSPPATSAACRDPDPQPAQLHCVVMTLMKPPSARRAFAATVLLGSLTMAACGGDDDATSPTTPAPAAAASTSTGPGTAGSAATAGAEFNDADVEFAQSMIAHHEQAIEMAEIAEDPARQAGAEVVALAGRIKAAQDPEIELMTGWLEAWGQPVQMDTSDGHDMSEMTGMMSAEDMDALGTETGAEFDDMWLTMMVEHHEGAIDMATAIQADGASPDVKNLAGQIVAAQQAEVDEMNQLLDA